MDILGHQKDSISIIYLFILAFFFPLNSLAKMNGTKGKDVRGRRKGREKGGKGERRENLMRRPAPSSRTSSSGKKGICSFVVLLFGLRKKVEKRERQVMKVVE